MEIVFFFQIGKNFGVLFQLLLVLNQTHLINDLFP